MFLLRVETQQNVILVGIPQKQAGQIHCSLRPISLRLQWLKTSLVPDRDHADRRNRVNIGLGKQGLKHPAHALKLIGNVPPLLFAGIGHDGEMRTPHLHPGRHIVAGPRLRGKQKKQQNQESPHGYRRIVPCRVRLQNSTSEPSYRSVSTAPW
jgi:hypothetical protein